MNEKQLAEIDVLMKRHDARTEKRADGARADDAFGEEFSRLREEVIKPAMEQVAEKLKAGSHHATISDANGTSARSHKNDEGAEIRLEILPAGVKRERYGKNDLPGVTFTIEPGMKVGVYSRSGRPDEEIAAGPLRRFRLSEVTSEMVTTEIVEVLRKTF